MAYSAKHAVNEATYTLKRSGRYIGGQMARMGLRFLTAAGAAIAGVSGNAGFFYVSGLIGVGTGVGLQAYLNHKDYEHNKEQLASLYRKELGSFLGKDPNRVTVDDLENAAHYNQSIREQLARERTVRNVKTGVWMVCGALGFITASALVATAGVAAPLAAVVGLTAFMASRPLVTSVGDKMYKLNEPTTVEIVKSLEWQRTKGKKVSRAQVMEAYISASPQLEQMIEKHYDKKFMELGMGEQQRVMLQFGQQIMLDEVTQAINENRMNARELTFRIHGQVSGAYPDPSYKEQWDSGIAKVKEKAQSMRQNVQQAGSRAMSGVSRLVGYGQSDDEPAVEEAASTTWQDREDARRAETPSSPQQGV